MGLTAPKSFFSIHSVSPYNRTNGEFYGELRVLDNSSLSLTAELIELRGGSSKFNYDIEVGDMTSEMSLSFKEYPAFVFELFAGNTPTENTAEATGDVSTLTDKLGTVVVATTGIASVGAKAGSESNLKFGRYLVKIISADTADIFYSSDADIGRGTNGEYQNDLLKITETPLTIPAGSAVEIPNFGLELTGGSGAIALTIGDTAEFIVRPINSGSMVVKVGSLVDLNFPEFGAIIMAAKKGNQEMVEIDAFRCKAAGLPVGLARNEYSAAEITVKLMYDSTRDGIYELRTVKPV